MQMCWGMQMQTRQGIQMQRNGRLSEQMKAGMKGLYMDEQQSARLGIPHRQRGEPHEDFVIQVYVKVSYIQLEYK